MKFIDEYRDPLLAQGLVEKIRQIAEKIARPVTLMEICGSHTYAIGHSGNQKTSSRDDQAYFRTGLSRLCDLPE